MGKRGQTLQPRSHIEAALAATEAELAYPSESDPEHWFLHGAIQAYRWLLGQTPAGPASDQTAEVSIAEIEREEQMARDALYGVAGARPLHPDWAVGVENALMWARGLCDAPIPYTAPAADQRAA